LQRETVSVDESKTHIFGMNSIARKDIGKELKNASIARSDSTGSLQIFV